MVTDFALPGEGFLMRKMGLKFTLLLTMIFVGQSVFASSLPCLFMDASSDITMGSAHEGHTMEPGLSSSTTANDCCGDGLCSVSSCISSVGLADSAISQFGNAPQRLWLKAAVSSPIHFSSPDIRPPISS
jgi:hypothetical protein